MSCSDIEKLLDDYVDGELADELRQSVETHVRACLSCRRALTELESLLERAGRLSIEIEPEDELWPRIESRITGVSQPGDTTATETRERSPWRQSRWISGWSPLAAAAMLLLALAVPMLLWQSRPRPVEVPPVAHAEESREEAPAAILARAEDGVLLPRTDLLEILERQRGVLSPETLAALEQSADLLDEAIAEVRTAMNANPESRNLEHLLAARYQQEVTLLKRATRI